MSESRKFVQILIRPQVYDILCFAEGDPSFLGVCWRPAATIAKLTDNSMAPGLVDLELQWSKCTGSS